MPGGKSSISEYRRRIDPILWKLDFFLDQLGEADEQIADELMNAERKGRPIKPTGASYLEVFRDLHDSIQRSRNEMGSLTPPPSLRVFQTIYVKALDKCLESISFRIKACVYIVEGDETEAEKALRQVKLLTEDFKRIEEEALKNME